MTLRIITLSGTRRPVSSISHNFQRLQRSFVSLPVDRAIEEETLPHYNPDQFFPVHIGNVLNDRYNVTGKLGYGAYSTSWLCQNLRTQTHVVLKVSTFLRNFPTAAHREVKVYEHLASIKSTHPCQSLVRELYVSFELQGNAGKHQCLALQPMHMTLLEVMGLNKESFDLPLIKMTLRRLLLALDFLHTEANVIHTDLKTDNLMLSIEDSTILTDFEDEEVRQPSLRRNINESHPVYQSRRFRRPLRHGLPILCDFGEARVGRVHESGPFIQPHIYRAPEVIFEMTWGSAIDIWNLGALSGIFEGSHLFGDIFDDNGNHDPFKQLALMVALIGSPSVEFIKRSEPTEQCFDNKGNWVAHGDAIVPQVSLDSLEKRLSGSEKEQFISFLKSMLRWLPEERKTAKQLLDDPWLR
ncbi:hypothetical protein N7493_004079 [Penicillium malachiteum]|uniref:Protein kinase domain-containing protein n=1 Tax=Penicillium malachiteum TaxID=1324776 RepID=A0AAD6HQW6_9EURO|nr:hypothetical protein N7493_004079 [Penicillium malachiteum]